MIGDENDCAEVWYRDAFWVSRFAGCCNRPVLKTATHTCYLHHILIVIKTNWNAAQIVHQHAEHKVPHKLYISLQNTKCPTICTTAYSTRSAAQVVHQPAKYKVPHKLYINLQNTKFPTSCTSAWKAQSAPQLVQQPAAHEVPHKLYISLQNIERRTNRTSACSTWSVAQVVHQPAEHKVPHKLYINLQNTKCRTLVHQLQNTKCHTNCTSTWRIRSATSTTACRTQSVPRIVRQPAEHRAPHKLYISLQHIGCHTNCTPACSIRSAAQVVHQSVEHKVTITNILTPDLAPNNEQPTRSRTHPF